jgi:plastocyanin
VNQGKNLNYLIGGLIIIALSLGAFIASRYLPPNLFGTTKTATSSATTSADEKAVLKFPPAGATADQIRAHSDLVQKLAKKTGNVNIGSSCSVDPIVLQLNAGQDFTLTNKDSADHILNIGEIKLTTPANSQKTFKADFGKGAGNYGYSCDAKTDVIGIFQVVPVQ